ncbi:MAG: nuclear transport factor 2 family protein [Pseudomonadota bacterium]
MTSPNDDEYAMTPFPMRFLLLPLVIAASATWASESSLERYLDALSSGSVNDLPLTDDVTFYGALLPAPIVGREPVINFLNRVLPSIRLKEVRQRFEGNDGACAELRFEFEGLAKQLEEAHCLEFEGELISRIRLYYDPRPLMGEPTP